MIRIIHQIRDFLLITFNIVVTIPAFILIYGGAYFEIFKVVFGAAIVLAGIILFIQTILLFHRIGNGTLAIWQQTTNLIVAGPYRFCRNPMIASVIIMLSCESLLFSSLYIFYWTIVFFLYYNLYLILIEEPGLIKRFGRRYKIYKENVPRWIPRLKPFELNDSMLQ